MYDAQVFSENPANPSLVMDLLQNTDPAKCTGLVNCHVPGLTSVVLHPGDDIQPMIRMFVAMRNNLLWRNDIHQHVLDYAQPLSLAIHAHHCDITMVPLYGIISNFRCTPVSIMQRGYQKYQHQSVIMGAAKRQHAVLTPIDVTGYAMQYDRSTLTHPTQSLWLRGDTLHTVSVPQGTHAAWIIVEGDKNLSYEPICYTDALPGTQDASYTMYQKMTPAEITDVLQYVTKNTQDNINQ